MGREIRLVVPNWEHPKYQHTDYLLHRTEMRYQPMFDSPYSEAIEVWIKNHQLWEAGNHQDQLDGSGKDCRYFAEWSGDAPEVKYYRPDWKPEEMTWYQVYETVSEGTPVTPPFATRDELIDYLVNHGDFWDQQRGDKPWTRKQAERFVNGPQEGGLAMSKLQDTTVGI